MYVYMLFLAGRRDPLSSAPSSSARSCSDCPDKYLTKCKILQTVVCNNKRRRRKRESPANPFRGGPVAHPVLHVGAAASALACRPCDSWLALRDDAI